VIHVQNSENRSGLSRCGISGNTGFGIEQRRKGKEKRKKEGDRRLVL
jgi:hypothetical protein